MAKRTFAARTFKARTFNSATWTGDGPANPDPPSGPGTETVANLTKPRRTAAITPPRVLANMRLPRRTAELEE